MNKAVVTKHQVSITEWFAKIGETEESNAFRVEDNQKASRLETLYQEIGLAYERPEKFSARDLTDKTSEFAEILEKRGDELCAIRLVPKRDDLPKLRNRGLSIKECYEDWFLKQNINPDDYEAHICPHSGILLWSAIFVVNQEAIFGEIIRGLHSQLTHGDTENKLIQFRYDFKDWQWSDDDPEAKEMVKQIIEMIKVDDPEKQEKLVQLLDAKFSRNYLAGYMETTVWPDGKIRYVDYNRILSKYIPSPKPLAEKHEGLFQGVSASPGVVEGKVVIVSAENIDSVNFSDKAILVCDNTDVRYLPYMKKAAAIITNRGGILTHAAIISRELGIPCVINTKNATEVLKDGDKIEVDADKGIIKKIR